MQRQKRVMAIHDISCFGKCSLTVALPIISATGIEVSVIPTAVLSTHTGGFEGFTFRDLTDDILPIVEHWQNYDINFNSIYTGYLGSDRQIDIVKKIFEIYDKKDKPLKVVDPVMADDGVLYKSFPATFPKSMLKLCKAADIITPNITEAVLLLDEEYKAGPYTLEYIEGLIKRLSKLTNAKIVLTGVWFDDNKYGAATYDNQTDKFYYYLANRIEGYYHGTGDVFGSACVAALLNGKTLEDSIKVAVDFTVQSIQRTKDAGTDIRFGVDFESGLQTLSKELSL